MWLGQAVEVLTDGVSLKAVKRSCFFSSSSSSISLPLCLFHCCRSRGVAGFSVQGSDDNTERLTGCDARKPTRLQADAEGLIDPGLEDLHFPVTKTALWLQQALISNFKKSKLLKHFSNLLTFYFIHICVIYMIWLTQQIKHWTFV